jgi:chromosome segregation ATPase
MPRRTLREARSVFEQDLAPTLNPTMHGRVEEELRQAEARATRHAEAFLATEVGHVESARQQLLIEACQVRDAYEALSRRVAVGEVKARDAARELTELNRQRQTLQEALDATEDRIGELALVEDDPLGWADRRYLAAPLTQPLFTF